MNFHVKIPKSIRAVAPYACAALLLTLPAACGGGGGGGGGLGTGPAGVTITNLAAADPNHVSDGTIDGVGSTNTFALASVTITDTGSGDFETFYFAPAIPPGGVAPIPGGLPAGTYSFTATYVASIFPETDQAPADAVILVAGTTNINFEY